MRGSVFFPCAPDGPEPLLTFAVSVIARMEFTRTEAKCQSEKT